MPSRDYRCNPWLVSHGCNRAAALLSPTALRVVGRYAAWRRPRRWRVTPRAYAHPVGQGHGGDLRATPCPELLEPDTPGIRFPLDPPDDGDSALEQQPAQIWIAPFVMTPRTICSGAMLRRHQPEPRRTMAAIFEGPRVVDRGDKRGGGERPTPATAGCL